MTPEETYKAYKREVGKDALKAMAFFFIGLPLIVSVIVFALMWL